MAIVGYLEEKALFEHLVNKLIILVGMNGKALFEQVATRCPGLRVVFMSGYTEDVIAHRGVLDVGVHFIQKPFSMQTLAEKVREVLEG